MLNITLTILIILFLLLSLLLIIDFVSTLFMFLFLYVEQKTRISKGEKLAPMPLKTYFKKYLTETCYINLKFILFPLRFLNLNKNTSKNQTKQTEQLIVLIHGYGRAKTDWLWFQRKLAQSISMPIYSVNLAPATGSIQQISENLKDKLEHITSTTNCDNITLISHSMGGLVASYLSEHLDQTRKIKQLILIGSPLHGTKLAFLGHGQNAKQMEPNSKFLAELTNKVQDSAKDYFFIASEFDNIVLPWHSCLLEQKITDNNKLILKTTTHQGLLYSNDVVAKVVEWL